MSIPDTLITTYLEMRSIEDFRPAFIDTDAQILRMDRPDVGYYRFLYGEVGALWHWRDLYLMRDDDLREWLSAWSRTVDVLFVEGVPAGYVQLGRTVDDVEIEYFGLRPAFLGRGLGKYLLSYGVAQAWALETIKRVWLHTCNLDGPHALKNYLARGFTVYDEHREPMPGRYRRD